MEKLNKNDFCFWMSKLDEIEEWIKNIDIRYQPRGRGDNS